jgi:uncharacterized protein (DUF488 family)
MVTVSELAIHSVGHGTLPAEELTALLREAGIARVVDVRSFPGSRRNPQYGREAMERWLPTNGIAYGWLPSLGGRRRGVEGSRHVALRHPSFRAYADHMETAEFRSGVGELIRLAEHEPTAAMCSESVWWRCHRRLIADHLVLLRGLEVTHLMHDGRLSPHRPTEGVRVDGGELVYDAGSTPPLPLDEHG